MKKTFFFTIIIVFYVVHLQAQNTITVSQGTSPTINGIISTGEWDDATQVTYQAGSSPNIITVTVYIKHNGSDTLYIAQNMPDMLSGDRDLVVFDKNNNGGSYPQADDFMMNKYHFPTGAPLLEGQANGSDWNWVTPSGWICALTGYDWSSNQGQIEFAVSFSKLGITSGIQKTIGFGILFGDYQSYYNPSTIWGWPVNTNPGSPDSWGDMVISFTTDINEIVYNETTVFPNPANDKIFIEVPVQINTTLEIISTNGQILQVLTLQVPSTEINISDLAPGIYLLKVKNEKSMTVKKIIKQ